MNDIYVIGDVHGHYNELVKLINKLPNKFDSKICFVGDLIDRGPDSKKVVDLVKKYNYDCVLGNHEQMCIEHAGNPYNYVGGYGQSPLNNFGYNGGVSTLDSYGNLELLQNNIETFFLELPIFKHYPIKNKDGKSLIVTHSCCLNYINDIEDFDNIDSLDIEDIIWNRDAQNGYNYIKESKEYFNVFGHTITSEVIINNKFASIETGIAAKNRGGKLTCLAFPSMKIYQV